MALPRIKAGSEAYCRHDVLNYKNSPPSLFSPSGGVMITLKRPDGTAAVSEAAMSRTETGIYTYAHQTRFRISE